MSSVALASSLTAALISAPAQQQRPAAGAEGPTRRSDEIEASSAKSQPSGDDWESEILWEASNHVWKELSALLIISAARPEPDLSRFLAEDARVRPLRPEGGEVRQVGEFRVRRAPVDADPKATPLDAPRAFGALIEPFRGASDLRFEFETFGVEVRSESEFATRVLYHAFGTTPGGRLQQNAVWSVLWTRPKAGEDARIRDIEVSRFDEIGAPRASFVECTGSVLGASLLASPALAYGSDTWFGRTDAAGEWNFLGHNGIAVGDVDGDGLEDVFVALGNGLPNQLLLQNADGTVREAASEAGLAWLDDTKGALLIDYDNDGDLDLFAAVGSAIVVAPNDGRAKFAIKHSLRAATGAPFHSLAAADFDLDGDLDLYGVRYVKTRYGESYPLPYHDARNGPPNHLLRNDGEKGFTDVTREVGLDQNNDRFSTAAGWCDFDGDGDPDLYVANDFGRDNLYRNEGGRFVDVAAEAGLGDSAAGTGVSWGDSDLDGDLDLLVSNTFSSAGQRIATQPRFRASESSELISAFRHHALGNSLFVNAGNSFADRSDSAGVRMGRWAWGAEFCDFNGDGLLDVVVPNGFVTNGRTDDMESFFWRQVVSRSPAEAGGAAASREYENGWITVSREVASGASWSGRERNCTYLNLGDNRFVDVSALSGLDLPDDARALAQCDWDGDGDLDLWFKNRTGPVLRLWRNDRVSASAGGFHSLSLLLAGTTCNRDAVGARVTVEAGGRKLVREVVAGDGFLSQSTRWLVFGLGDAREIQRVSVRWPGGAEETFERLQVDRRYRLRQRAGAEEVARERKPILAAAAAGSVEARGPFRVLLRAPLALPATFNRAVGGVHQGRARLVHVWSKESAPCLAELSASAQALERYGAANLDVVALCLDPAEVQAEAQSMFERHAVASEQGTRMANVFATPQVRDTLAIVLEHVLARASPTPLPATLLIDSSGTLQELALGAVPPETWIADSRTWGLQAQDPRHRTLAGGTWLFGQVRDLATLSRTLRDRGLSAEADFYRDVLRMGLDR